MKSWLKEGGSECTDKSCTPLQKIDSTFGPGDRVIGRKWERLSVRAATLTRIAVSPSKAPIKRPAGQRLVSAAQNQEPALPYLRYQSMKCCVPFEVWTGRTGGRMGESTARDEGDGDLQDDNAVGMRPEWP